MKNPTLDSSWFRLLIATAIGVLVALATGMGRDPVLAVMAGWSAAGFAFVAWTWLRISRLSPEETKSHATSEDASRPASRVVVSLATIAAIAGVGVLLMASGSKDKPYVQAGVGVLAIAASWLVVHTLFTLRYARLYYLGDGHEIDFNEDDDPVYADFAYMAFSVGMTFQVSDTSIRDKAIRHTVLAHSLVSYVLGALVISSTINLVSALASSGS